MITDALQAWVIHKHWTGDTSARVVFFTQELGLVNCLYKGGRTPKKQALLQAFLPLWLVMDVKGEAYFVRQLEIAAAPIQLAGQPLFAGLYVNELLYYALKSHDPHETLHTAYVQVLKALITAPDRLAIEAVLRRFEWALLTSCGFQMSLTHDARSALPIDANCFYRFIAGEGFILAEQGICGAHIIAMAAGKLEEVAVLNAAKQVMRQAIHHALDGRVIKARALYGHV
jgi:DNA repair protein RecO (recombination protein O)